MLKCTHQEQGDKVTHCKRNPDVMGICVGVCEGHKVKVHSSICPECMQPKSSVESLNEMEMGLDAATDEIKRLRGQKQRLIEFINNSLEDHFSFHDAICLVSEVSD